MEKNASTGEVLTLSFQNIVQSPGPEIIFFLDTKWMCFLKMGYWFSPQALMIGVNYFKKSSNDAASGWEWFWRTLKDQSSQVLNPIKSECKTRSALGTRKANHFSTIPWRSWILKTMMNINSIESLVGPHRSRKRMSGCCLHTIQICRGYWSSKPHHLGLSRQQTTKKRLSKSVHPPTTIWHYSYPDQRLSVALPTAKPLP